MMKNKLPQLCSLDKCTACTACLNSCPQAAITMKENEKGELHPAISAEKCIGCGLCEKVCPEINDSLLRNELPTVYSCWLKDSTNRKQSTSGGVAYAISCAVIEQGGHVWGAAYADNMSPVYVEANTIEELRPIQKSKYVQCAPRDCFKKIKKELDNGELVLFTGTSCHAKGLLSFLRKKYDNLLTLDLVCHGVPGQGVFRKYKEYLERRYNDELDFFIFRPKRMSDGQEETYYTLAHFKNRGDVKVQKAENGYFVGFQRNIFLRECCYNCLGNGCQRYTDFTVADFWGVGKVKPFPKWRERTRGISMLALNTANAKSFFEKIKDKMEYELRSIEEAIFSNLPYTQSSVKSPRAEEFWGDWRTLTWEELTVKYFTMVGKDKILYNIKRMFPPICYYMMNYWRNGQK